MFVMDNNYYNESRWLNVLKIHGLIIFVSWSTVTVSHWLLVLLIQGLIIFVPWVIILT